MDQQTKTALKRDEFVAVTNQSLDWASENRRILTIAGSIGLALIIAIIVAGVIYSNRSEKASIEFGNGMALYQTAVQNPGEPAPAEVKTFKSAAERAKAANAVFLATANQYGMTPAGKNAKYFAGLTYMEAGENTSAESTLKSVAEGWDKQLASLAQLALAQLYQQTGRSQQAIALYSELTAKPTTSVPAGTAQLELAGLYASQGQTDQAKKIYAQLKDKDSKGAAGTIAAQKLNPAPAAAAPPLGEQ